MNRALQEAIDYCGGKSALADALGVEWMRLHQWTRRRVPAEWAPRIEAVTRGTVTAESLRPDVFGPINPPSNNAIQEAE